MPEFKNIDSGGMPSSEAVSDEMASKVGKAIGHIAEIKQAYRAEIAMAETDNEKQELSQRAELEAISAVSSEGLSVEQYNEVIAAADSDPDLEQRLLAAAQEI